MADANTETETGSNGSTVIVIVFDPAVRVTYVTVLACTPPVLVLVPALRMTAFASAEASVVAPEIAKLTFPESPLGGVISAVTITRACVVDVGGVTVRAVVQPVPVAVVA